MSTNSLTVKQSIIMMILFATCILGLFVGVTLSLIFNVDAAWYVVLGSFGYIMIIVFIGLMFQWVNEIRKEMKK